MTDNQETNDVEKAKSLVSTGSELAGAAVGGAIGFLAAGPVGAAGAGTLGVLVSKVGAKLLGDYAERRLSDRERVRVGAAAAIAFDKISSSAEQGEKPREDGFFDPKDDGRSAADEVLEGTLRRAQDEYQEKKVALLGNFYANVAFSPGVTVEEANYYLRLFDDLTYRQLCVICLLFMKPYQSELSELRKGDYRANTQGMSADTLTLLQEIFGLYNRGLVACRTVQGEGCSALLGWHDVIPAQLELTGLGDRFQKLFMAGGTFQYRDVQAVANLLR